MLVSQRYLTKLGLNFQKNELEKIFNEIGHEVDNYEIIENDLIVTGKVLDLWSHPNADKLQIAKVDLGKKVVQIICGAPNIKIGQCIIVATLGATVGDIVIEKRNLKGELSEGMICSLAEVFKGPSFYSQVDNDGIYIFPQEVELGTNVLDLLTISDVIYDLDLTADRGDCLSYRGLFYDLQAVDNFRNCKKNFNHFSHVIYSGDFETNQQLEIGDELTNEFSMIEIKDIQVDKSDEQLNFFLIKHNIKPQNKIVDLCNYLMLKYGNPLHTYDKSKINGKISTLKLTSEKQFIGLDKKEYLLPVGTLVCSDEEKIIAVAGVLGSLETSVTAETKDVLVELAVFDAVDVRVNSKIMKLSTDSSKRFERGVSRDHQENIFGELKQLLPGKYSHHKSEIKENHLNTVINFIIQDVRSILGITLSIEEIKNILQSLSMKISEENEEYLKVEIPSYRNDLKSSNDLLEEIVRISGIDNIPKVNLSISKIKSSDEEYLIQKEIQKNLLSSGLDQIITYSLIDVKNQVNYIEENVQSVTLSHPLSDLLNCYRQSLISSLIETATYNLNRQNSTVKIFEIANTYTKFENEIKENKLLSILMTGVEFNNKNFEFEKISYLNLKGIVDYLFASLGINYTIKQTSKSPIEFNQYMFANIYVGDQFIGVIGELDSDILEQTFVLEINYNMLTKFMNKEVKYSLLGNQPSIIRDLSITVDQVVNQQEVKKYLEQLEDLSSIELINVFENLKMEVNKKVLTYKLFFKNQEKTLKNDDIDENITKVIEKMEKVNYEVKNWLKKQ